MYEVKVSFGIGTSDYLFYNVNFLVLLITNFLTCKDIIFNIKCLHSLIVIHPLGISYVYVTISPL